MGAQTPIVRKGSNLLPVAITMGLTSERSSRMKRQTSTPSAWLLLSKNTETTIAATDIVTSTSHFENPQQSSSVVNPTTQITPPLETSRTSYSSAAPTTSIKSSSSALQSSPAFGPSSLRGIELYSFSW